MRETWVRSLGQEDPLEKEMATHSSILAWKTQWTEEPGRLQSTGLQRVSHDWATSSHTPSPPAPGSSHFFKVIKYTVKKLTKHMVEKFNQYSNVVSPISKFPPQRQPLLWGSWECNPMEIFLCIRLWILKKGWIRRPLLKVSIYTYRSRCLLKILTEVEKQENLIIWPNL